MPLKTRFAAAPAMLAALSLTAMPAQGAEMPLPATAQAHAAAVPVLDIEKAQTAEHRRHYRYRYRRGPGLGDVIAGVLIVGAIAHVAKAATRDDRQDRDRDYRRDARWEDGRGIDRAVDMCLDAIDRDRRVESVERVDRTARGWMVEGTLSRGGDFLCRIGDNGRIEDIDYTDRGARYKRDDDDRYEDGRYERDEDDRDEDADWNADEPRYDDENQREDEDGQWDDDRYASEWSRVDRDEAVASAAPQADYPGGLVEEDEAVVDSDLEIGTGYPGAGA